MELSIIQAGRLLLRRRLSTCICVRVRSYASEGVCQIWSCVWEGVWIHVCVGVDVVQEGALKHTHVYQRSYGLYVRVECWGSSGGFRDRVHGV